MQRRSFLTRFALGCGLGPELAAYGEEAWLSFRRALSESPADEVWNTLRAELACDPQVVPLNTGGGGCVPRPLLLQMNEAALLLEKNPSRHLWGDGLIREVEEARFKLCKAWGAETDELAFSENATSGLLAIGLGIDWAAGDEVVLTRHEHLSCQAVWKYLAKRFGLQLCYLELPLPEFTPDAFMVRLNAALTARTRLCCLCHVDSYSGVRLPIAQAATLLRERGVLSVCDAAQSMGMLDFRFSELGVDALATCGHKWMMGPKGTGLLYVRRAAQQRIRPAATDWSFSAMTPLTGTRNVSQLLAWQWLAELQTILQPSRIEARVRAMQELASRRLVEELRLEPLAHAQDRRVFAGMVAFRLPGDRSVWKVVPRLAEEFQVEIKPLPPTCELEPTLQTEHNAFRVSTHVYNTEQDIERLVAALRGIGL